jgi:hypothetical protein
MEENLLEPLRRNPKCPTATELRTRFADASGYAEAIEADRT